ncbi:PfkB family carbohydrate kinase [Agromyces soli]|uniref:PfkB family carbohydrate kinase n=1 Tax=Agromyces soli TaxID=659012 RepID=A0ABY4AU99_9MICO|nr:PfkB family carbohydrate kinase [Agromyces soli]UOE26713.1 PfkB family carbohydrate kinase [Agromyces soli]
MQQIAILSHIVVDEVHQPGRPPHTEVGGAGAYAAVGASLVAPAAGRSLLVSGTGSADLAVLRAWCAERGIVDGLFVVGEHGPRTRIDYAADGERVETPQFGLEHFDAHTPLPEHVLVPPEALDGAYLFHDDEEPYWAAIARYRARAAAVPLLWELSAACTRPDRLSVVRQRAELVDAVSINRTEAVELFGVDALAEAVEELRTLAPLVLLRLGEDGSLVIQGDTVVRVPAVRVAAVDPTGGGNSYTGAFLGAWAASGDPVDAARLASAAAAVVVATEGAPPVGDAERERVRRSAAALVARELD